MASQKYIRIRLSFNKIAKKLRDNGLDDLEINQLKDKVFATFDSLKKTIEHSQHKNKKSTERINRYIETVDCDSSAAKFTYRPENGQCLVKIPKNTPENKRIMLDRLADKVINGVPDSVKMTLRGTAHWSETKQGFRVTLADNNRTQYKLNFEN